MTGPRLPEAIRRAAETFAARVRQRFGAAVVRIELFGSAARGESREDSDVDLLVVLRDADWAARREILDMAYDIWLETDLPLSPTVLPEDRYATGRQQERPLVMAIERDGIPL